MPIVLCVGMRPLRPTFVYINMSTIAILIQIMFRESCS